VAGTGRQIYKISGPIFLLAHVFPIFQVIASMGSKMLWDRKNMLFVRWLPFRVISMNDWGYHINQQDFLIENGIFLNNQIEFGQRKKKWDLKKKRKINHFYEPFIA
jgi:hypothetical protein